MGERARGYTNTHPPFGPGNQVARKHGVWAADVDQEALAVLNELYHPNVVERFPAMALLGAECWVRRRRALADIAERGQVLDDDKPHPLLRYVGQWERTLLELSTRFGLDPKSEADLARGTADAARSVVDLDAIRARGRGSRDPVDAGESA